MKILLVGAGSIGGTTSVMLKEKGADIRIVEANKERAEKIREEGLKLTGALGEHCQKLTVYTSKDELPEDEKYDVLIIATKYFALQAVAREYKDVVKDDGLFVSMQNGICTNRLAEVVGAHKTVGCMIGFGATLKPDGVINVTSGGELKIGRLNGVIDDKIKELAAIYNYLLPTVAVDNIEACLYSKLIVNSCINSIAALTGEPVGNMLKSEKAKLIFLEIAREATYAAKKSGIKVPPYAKVLNYNLLILSEKMWFKKICALVVNVVGSRFGDVRPSTLQSLDRGEKTEIDIFNGYIIEQGKKAGVPTPVNQQIYDFIKAIENGEKKSSMSNLDEIVL
ncbi:MAG: ketopantoate reductase family protein [Clostridia bacterium]|nr:ketopantoate reductase family protein [Clostridia bacterium]